MKKKAPRRARVVRPVACEDDYGDDWYGADRAAPRARRSNRKSKPKKLPKGLIRGAVGLTVAGLFVAAGCFVIPLILDAVKPDPAVEAVRQAFTQFRKDMNISRQQGDRYARHFDEESYEYFRQIAEYCSTAERSKLRELPYTQVYYILSFRHASAAEKIRHLSGRELIAYGFEGTYLSGEGFRIKPDRIEIEGDTALIWDNQAGDSINMKMVREGETWKVSLVHMYSQMDKIMESQISGDREIYVINHLDIAKWAGPANEQLFRLPINGTSYY